MSELTRRYAQALYQVCPDEDGLRETAGALMGDAALWEALTSPAVEPEAKGRVLARLPAIYRFDLFCSEDISNLIRYERDLFVIVESNGSDFGYGLALQRQTGDRELLHPQDTLAKPYLKVLLKTDYEHIEQNNLQQFYEQIFDMGYSPGRTFGKVLVSVQEQGLTNFYEAWIELISA